MARILAFDVSCLSGWAVMQDGVLESSGSVKIRGDEGPVRFWNAYEVFGGLMAEHEPDFVAIELVNFSKFRLAYRSFCSLRAVLLLCCAEHGLDCVEVDTTTLKGFWTNNKKAAKSDMCRVARERTGLELRAEGEPGYVKGMEDQADAIAVGFWADSEYEAA